MTANADLISKFVALGMSEQKAIETLKNVNVTKHLVDALNECNGIELPEGAGMLLYHMSTKIKQQIALVARPILVKLIVDKKLNTTARVDAALDYLLTRGQSNEAVDAAALEKFCGVGIVVTPEQIEVAVDEFIKANKKSILDQRYRFNIGKIMQHTLVKLPWADGKHVKNEIEVQLFDLLGDKTAADLAPPTKQDKQPKEKKQSINVPEKIESNSVKDSAQSIAELMKKVRFHAPGENHKTDGYVITENTERLLKEHLKQTSGMVHTRFPPEPNGILHIGHAKAININFGYAAVHNGSCYLRYDDTNPEKEEEKFFIGIKDMVEWLGYKPTRITHSSDNFQQLYEWATILIEKGLAYVCHQSADDMKGFNPLPSPWRDRPIKESLRLFQDMKNGKIDEGKATLRMKITLEEGKMDPVAYRIKFMTHHRTKDEWCIYPTYDYTHCLCDSIENITHSLCTKEFQSRRSSYYWLCNALDIYCPVQWEYGRLNVNYTVVSKRKIAKLITEGIVKDWDDPRLFTLTALRRRGFPPEAINNFCAQMGVTGAQGAIDPSMLEASVRDFLNVTAPRVLVVLDPLKVTIVNFPFKEAQTLVVPNFPNDPSLGSHQINFDKVIYIERSDFTESPDKGYRRLAPDQAVGLRHAGFVLKVLSNVKNSDGIVTELVCACESTDTSVKPKAFVQWVSNPIEIEVRLYESLFRHKNPEDVHEVPGGFLSDCNLNSLHKSKSFVDASMIKCRIYDKFQFERIGFFSVDSDSTNEMLVFNRTVTLKEDAGKTM